MKQPTPDQMQQWWDTAWAQRDKSSWVLGLIQQAYAAGAASHDCRQMHDMLQSMQSGEMSVSRGVELLEMWLVGNYTPDQLPPAQNILPDDRMPWDEIDLLRVQLADAQERMKAGEALLTKARARLESNTDAMNAGAEMISRLGAELAALRAQEPIGWLWVYTRLDGHKEKRVVWASDFKDSKADLAFVLRGKKETEPVYAAPTVQEPTCPYCDGTGDVHGIDGEWRGSCNCAQVPQEPVNQMLLGALKELEESTDWTWDNRARVKARAAIAAAEQQGGRSMTKPEALRLADRLESSDPDFDDCTDAGAELRRMYAVNQILLDCIDSIYIYANDTLSGRTDGPSDASWYRSGIAELRNRARKFTTAGSAVVARAAIAAAEVSNQVSGIAGELNLITTGCGCADQRDCTGACCNNDAADARRWRFACESNLVELRFEDDGVWEEYSHEKADARCDAAMEGRTK